MNSTEQTTILTPEEVLEQFENLRHHTREHVGVLYLNSQFQLLYKHILLVGDLQVSPPDPGDIFHYALVLPCSSIIVIHNHPNHDVTPSRADVSLMHGLKLGAEFMEIQLTDYVVVTNTDYFSFREHSNLL